MLAPHFGSAGSETVAVDGEEGIGVMDVFSYCFFFSSRRRHTRCSRDWSSDVCSSDLVCTYTKCEREGGDEGEAGRLPQHAEAKAQILPTYLHKGFPAARANDFLTDLDRKSVV